MNEGNEGHRCVICGKLLLDEKLPICKRCILKGRNNVGKIAGVAGVVVISGKAKFDKHSNT